MMHTLLPLTLALTTMLSSLASATPISLVQPQLPIRDQALATSEWSSLTDDTAQLLGAKSAIPHGDATTSSLAKRAPYYFPETVPDEQELASRLTALREAGFMPSSSLHQAADQIPDPKSIDTLVVGIDTSHAPALLLPDRDTASESGSSGEPSWSLTAPYLPSSFLLFFIVAAVLCIVTVLKGVRRGKL